MEDFAACRGFVMALPAAAGSTSKGGFYSLEPPIANSETAYVLINGFEGSDSDVVAPVITLNRSKILYNFGNEFSQINITGTILMDKAGSKNEGFKAVQEYFEQNRSSNNDKTISVSSPAGDAFKLFLISLNFSVPDQQFHIQRFTLSGLIAQPAGKV